MERSKRTLYKNKKNDSVWWVNSDAIGMLQFTFDKKKVYSLFGDYPENIPVSDWVTFTIENPYWANFFAGRNLDFVLEHYSELVKEIGQDNVEKLTEKLEKMSSEKDNRVKQES